jgi:hypothetical protein
MQSQKDDVTNNVFSYYYVARTRSAIQLVTKLRVFDLAKRWTPRTTVEKIDTVIITKDNLMDETKMLIARLCTEFDCYFPEPYSDQLIMMMMYPIMLWAGFRYAMYC